MFISMLADIDNAITSFFTQLTASIGFGGYLGIALGVEVFFILLFLLKSAFSYEARLKRNLIKYNNWLFKNKKLDKGNIKEFSNLVKKGTKRVVYYWQQFILFREGGPTNYMSEENLIEKPLKTSSWSSNIKNLIALTSVWAVVCLLFGFASQAGRAFSLNLFAIAFVIPAIVLVIGILAVIALKEKRVINLDDIYQNYHIFARFITNASIDLPDYIDYELLFTQKEITRGNPQLREFYEAKARKAKEEFEKAKQKETEYVEYNFEKAGVDGALVLERAMKESEDYINKKQNILSKIADIEAQKEALKRNYENKQKDLQKKIQSMKESIAKLLQQQEATTNRMEVTFLKTRQDQDRAKQEQFQSEYDQEETQFAISNDELNKQLQELRSQLDESKLDVEQAMLAEYQAFYEKVLKVSMNRAENKVKNEVIELRSKVAENDNQLMVVQTQLKRMTDENAILKDALQKEGKEVAQEALPGHYDENGNYVYEDGSYHDPNGLYHDKNGTVYDANGNVIEQEKPKSEEEMLDNRFGSFELPDNENPEDKAEIEKAIAEQFGGNLSEEKPKENAVEEPANKEKAEKSVNDTDKTNEDDNAQDKITDEKKQGEGSGEEALSAQEQEQKPAKKRGRPRKPTAETEEVKVPRKRGRPRKETQEAKVEEVATEEKPTKKRSPYKKTAGRKPSATKKASQAKKNSSSTNKETSKKKSTAKKPASESTKKASTPKKSSAKSKSPTLSQISKLISEEEEKLNKMKAFINSEIDDVMNNEDNSAIDKEKDEIMKTVEDLKEKAENVKQTDKSETELSNINKRLEELIKEISALNNKK